MNFKALKTGKFVLSFIFVADKTEMGGAEDMTYTFKVSIILKNILYRKTILFLQISPKSHSSLYTFTQLDL